MSPGTLAGLRIVPGDDGLVVHAALIRSLGLFLFPYEALHEVLEHLSVPFVVSLKHGLYFV